MLPYLEAFYQYGGAEVQPSRQWSSDEDDLFHTPDSRSVPSTSQSLASVNPDRSMETISGRRSRMSSQENGMCATSSLTFSSAIYVSKSFVQILLFVFSQCKAKM